MLFRSQVGGELAVDENCCCTCNDTELGCCCFGSFNGTTQSLNAFGVTQCDCNLMGGTWKADCSDCNGNDGYGTNNDAAAPSGKCNICKTITIIYSSYDQQPLQYDQEQLCDNSCPSDCVSDPGNTNCAASFPGFPGTLSGSLTCVCVDCGAGSECSAHCHLDTHLSVSVSFQKQTGACTSFTQTSTSSTLPLQ